MNSIPKEICDRFAAHLYKWAEDYPRQLPWKGERDPYRVWLSEILLQQTQVSRGIIYYDAFVSRFSSIEALAAASDDDVFKLWEGLGYYSRCRNMLKAARLIVNELDGRFPSTYSEILKLPGVGPYTAAAIASFAFGEPKAVLDGNVYRIYARFFGVDLIPNAAKSKSHFQNLADQMLDRENPARFNQALMDFGATHCTPRNAKCETCAVRDLCFAFQHNRVEELPRKKTPIKKRERRFAYLVITDESDQTLLLKRPEGDIWAGLYSFPLIECDENHIFEKELETFLSQSGLEVLNSVQHSSKQYKQTLSHQKIFGSFYGIRVNSVSHYRLLAETAYESVAWSSLGDVAFPRMIRQYLEDRFSSLFEF